MKIEPESPLLVRPARYEGIPRLSSSLCSNGDSRGDGAGKSVIPGLR